MARGIYLLGVLCIVGFRRTSAYGVPEVGLGFDVEPRDVVVARGRSVTLPCAPSSGHLTNGSGLTVRWDKDNVPLVLRGDKRREVLADGSLFIRKAQSKGEDGVSDSGEYRCIAQTPFGSLSSRPAHLRFAVLGHGLSEAESTVTSVVGSNLRLSCHIDAIPAATVTWERDEFPLPDDSDKYVTFRPGEVLYILNLVPEDSAKYRCIATNVISKKSRTVAQVLVSVVPPSPGYRPTDFLPSVPRGDANVPLGGNLTLECATFGPSRLSWSLNKKELSQVTMSGVNILHLQDTSVGNSGNYTCRSGSAGSLVRRVVLQTPPKFLERPEGQKFFAARTIRFHCVVQGNPIPQVYWLKDGVRVNINGRIKHKQSENETTMTRTSELVLSSSVALDSGVYQCMAYNEHGVIWAASRLNLTLPNPGRPPPQPPTHVTCDTLSASQVLVSWVVLTAAHDFKAFSIHYSLTGGIGERQLVTPPINRSAIVDKLLPYTNYTFSVRVYSDSASDFSEKVVCLTGEEVPIDAPDIHLESTNPNSLRVEWQPLPSNLSRGVIVEYRVQWKRKGSPSYIVETVNADVFDYTITGLSPGQDYEVRVLAATQLGIPVVSIPWTDYTMPAKLSASLPAAPNVTLSAVNSSAVRASWNLTHSGLLGYKLFLRPQNGRFIGPFLLNLSETSFLFNDLVPETSYDVMVFGYSAEGEGETTATSIHTPPRESESASEPSESFAPEPPINLEADPVNSTAIRVKWTPIPGSNVSYTVCYRVLTSLGATNCLTSAKNELTVVNLVPNTLYEFRVKSTDMVGRNSSDSDVIECPTHEDVPTEVLSVHWKLVNKSAIRVTWREPEKKNGLLKNYTVSYTDDHQLPLSRWKSVAVPSNKYSAELGNLNSQARYLVMVRAATSAGYGPGGSANTPVSLSGGRRASSSQSNGVVHSDAESDQNVGVIVGLSIGLLCMIICGICILCRRRCSKTRCTQQTPRGASSGGDCTNGHEMEYLSQFAAADPQHVDSKGHYPNGVVNGVRLPLVTNGRVPTSAIHITDNPRYDPSSSESPILGLQTFAPASRPSPAVSEPDQSLFRCASTSSSQRFAEDTLPTSIDDSRSSSFHREPDESTPVNESQRPLLDRSTPECTSPILSNPEFAFSTEVAEPRSVGWLRSPVVCSGSESVPFTHVRGKPRSPVASIFDVPDSPPGKPSQLIIDDYNFA